LHNIILSLNYEKYSAQSSAHRLLPPLKYIGDIAKQLRWNNCCYNS